VTEGGEGGAESLQGDDVVLLVPLVGVKRPCTGGSMGGRAAADLGAHRRCGGVMVGRGKMKLVGLKSTSESLRCSGSTGLKLGGSKGG
jgi:hypothetical protein